MTQDVAQWLAEIQSLQQQVAQLQQEYDIAQASADRWRDLYNQEAQQRRKDTKADQDTINDLHARIEEFKQGGKSPEQIAATQRQLIKELNRLKTDEIKQKFFEAIEQLDASRAEVDRLQQALSAEKAEHEQTRKSLTTALGDTVELLAQARESAKKKRPQPSLPGDSTASTADDPNNTALLSSLESIKNPLLELPPLD